MNKTIAEVVRRVGQESTSVEETMVLAIAELGLDRAQEIADEIAVVMGELGASMPDLSIADVVEGLTSHGATTAGTIAGAVALGFDRAEVVAETRRQLAEWDDNSLEWWLVEENKRGDMDEETCEQLADEIADILGIEYGINGDMDDQYEEIVGYIEGR